MKELDGKYPLGLLHKSIEFMALPEQEKTTLKTSKENNQRVIYHSDSILNLLQ
jgi:hypothetical protein